MIKVNGSDTHLSDATALGYAYAIIIFSAWYGMGGDPWWEWYSYHLSWVIQNLVMPLGVLQLATSSEIFPVIFPFEQLRAKTRGHSSAIEHAARLWFSVWQLHLKLQLVSDDEVMR